MVAKFLRRHEDGAAAEWAKSLDAGRLAALVPLLRTGKDFAVRRATAADGKVVAVVVQWAPAWSDPRVVRLLPLRLR